MTGKDKKPYGSSAAEPPPIELVPPPVGPVPPDDKSAPTEPEGVLALAVDATEPTLELPTEVLEPTVEVPREVVEPTSVTQALPVSEQTMQTTEPADAAGDNATEFTLTDVTLSEAEGGGTPTWLRDSGHKLGSLLRRRRPEETGAQAALQMKGARWGLRRWQFALVIAVGALILLFAAFVAIDSGLYYNEVHHGIKVAGQSLSGLSRDEASATLAGFVAEVQDRPIRLVGGERTWTVLPSDVDTTIDVPGAVSAALDLTRDGNTLSDLGKRLGLYFRDKDIPLNGSVNEDKMDLLLARIARQLDVPATNARLVIVDEVLEVEEGEPGSVVDQEALRTSLTDLLFTFHSTELQIPMKVDEPDVQAIDITPALAQANVMISADLALTYEGQTLVSFTPREIASYMDLVVQTEGGVSTTTPALSATKLSAVFDTLDDQIGTPGKNATMDSDGASVWVVPGEDGVGLDRQATATALTQAALLSTGRAAEVLMTSVPPDLTTKDVEALGVKDLLASYATTPYTGSAGRQQNVRLATSLCSGVLLAPGEEFNTDRRLGVRDAAHGWATAPGIVGFGEMEDVYGGGICQVSTTLFNAVLEAGLEIVERHNHSIFINHYPDGRDATVTAGGKNMRFRNDTDHYIFIYGQSTGIKTKFFIWGVSDGRTAAVSFSGFTSTGIHGETIINNPALPPGTRLVKFEGQNGLECYIIRTVTYADGTTKTEKFKSRYPIIPAMIEMGPAVTTTTAGPTTTAPPTTAPPAPTTTATI